MSPPQSLPASDSPTLTRKRASVESFQLIYISFTFFLTIGYQNDIFAFCFVIGYYANAF